VKKIYHHEYILSERHPKLAKYFHPTKNKMYTKNSLTKWGKLEIWWTCIKKHSYKETIRSRLKRQDGINYFNTKADRQKKDIQCKICNGTILNEQNSLATLKPELLQFFDYKKNYPLTPEKTPHNYATEIFWLCPKGHGIKERPGRFMINGIFLCKKCKSRVFRLSKEYPKIANMLHPTKNNSLTGNDLYPWTTHKPFFTCKHNHYYQNQIRNIMGNFNQNGVSDCRICNGREVNEQNSLKIIFPEIAKQWDYKKNYPLTPDKVYWRLASKRIHWICSRKHPWATSVYHRTVSKSNCPSCDMASSLPELRIYSELSFFFKKIRHRLKILNAEADIYIENLKTIIEYDGGYYHKKRFLKDKEKTKLFLTNGYNLIRLREGDLEKIDNSIVFPKDKFNKKCIDQIFIKIKPLLKDPQLIDNIDKYIGSKEFINDALYQELRINLPSPPYNESLAYLKPKLAKEWDYKKNYPLRPEHYRQNSAQYAHWICVNESNHPGWKAQISNRNTRKSGCPDCKSTLLRINKIKSIKKISIKDKIKNIETIYDFDKNEIKNLQQINTFTKYTYNWKCYHCNYSWSQSPNSLLQKFRNGKNRIAIICCRECKKDLKIKFK
jgi:hypothetical protein